MLYLKSDNWLKASRFCFHRYGKSFSRFSIYKFKCYEVLVALMMILVFLGGPTYADICRHCKGTRVCSYCNGSGRANQFQKCYSCYGNGRCQFCRGTGSIETVDQRNKRLRERRDVYSEQSVRQGPSCFIATAAYGSPLADEVETLREFRDTYMTQTHIGCVLVSLYYKCSPPIAKVISKSRPLRFIVRGALGPIVLTASIFLFSPVTGWLFVALCIVGTLLALKTIKVYYIRWKIRTAAP